MAKHKTFTVATNVKVYFCDPQSPWQRGTNENTNRLLRQYFPRRTDLRGYKQSELDAIAMRLNQRPRKTLGFFRKPLQVDFEQVLHRPIECTAFTRKLRAASYLRASTNACPSVLEANGIVTPAATTYIATPQAVAGCHSSA